MLLWHGHDLRVGAYGRQFWSSVQHSWKRKHPQGVSTVSKAFDSPTPDVLSNLLRHTHSPTLFTRVLLSVCVRLRLSCSFPGTPLWHTRVTTRCSEQLPCHWRRRCRRRLTGRSPCVTGVASSFNTLLLGPYKRITCSFAVVSLCPCQWLNRSTQTQEFMTPMQDEHLSSTTKTELLVSRALSKSLTDLSLSNRNGNFFHQQYVSRTDAIQLACAGGASQRRLSVNVASYIFVVSHVSGKVPKLRCLQMIQLLVSESRSSCFRSSSLIERVACH